LRSLLVTGGAGFIGCNFVQFWLQRHPTDRVVVLDALTYAGDLANLEPVCGREELRFVQGNICDTQLVTELLNAEQIDTIVHFAAESHVDRSISGPDLFIETNVGGTHSLLKAARDVWLQQRRTPQHRFHHVSTDEVYGSLGSDDPAFTENTRYAPNSPYSASKAAADHLVRAYGHTYGLAFTISNCSNNYGPYHFPEKLIPQTIVNILLGRPVPVYGDGRNVRDWLHVGDHCRGIERILLAGRAGEVYNIGGRCEQQNLVLVQSLCDVVDECFARRPSLRERFADCPASSGASSRRLITFVTDRAGHDRRYAIDCSKLERELQYAVTMDLVPGLTATAQWFIDNESWWRAALNRCSRR
jgi:dTDP-glucose 4,6-dehydratase